MPSFGRSRISASAHTDSSTGSISSFTSSPEHQHAAHSDSVKSRSAHREPLSSLAHNLIINQHSPTATRPVVKLHHSNHAEDSLSCLKPLPSVPKDVDADDGLEEDGTELVHRPRASLHDQIDSDISSASASSAASSTASSSMETNWQETSLRHQVARLDIQYTDVDLSQTQPPSVFGLRRRIVAAALDHAVRQRHDGDPERASGSSSQFQDQGMSEWLALPQPTSPWKDRILRKKKSFGKKQAKAASASQASSHGPMPDSAASSISDSPGRNRFSSTTGLSSSHDTMLRRDKELTEREVEFDLVVLSRFETAELKMTVYTEHRQGSWVVKGPAPPASKVLDEPPLIFSPWDCQIDSRAIVERKKLRSYVELSDTTCAVRCTTCSSAHHQRLGKAPETFRIQSGNTIACKHCQGSNAVQATYVVCVTLRQSTFLPLTMPARHQAGKPQNAFRAYLPKTTSAMSHVDLLRMRSMEAIRSCALRVGRAHHREHDARLLMAKAVLERRSCSSVAVINRLNGVFRTFDVTDGGCIRGGSGLIEESSRIVEMPELANALSRLPVTAVVRPEATYRFVDLEWVDMASSRDVSLEKRRSPSMYTMESSGDESYSPSAFSSFQRAQDVGRHGGNTSRDSHTLRGALPAPSTAGDMSDSRRHASNTAASQANASATSSSASSLRSFASAQQRVSTTSDASRAGMPNKSMARTVSTGSASTLLSGGSSVSARTAQSWQTTAGRQLQ
ncbi:hypothetical protein PHSY_001771 [Pseudozyma hubeiensis SY62]|uniref:Uncharacterized protein n=1 Tax=Pseudozyma hubeiensis (strain SY62) TaxID=1305764 RepID=R9P7X0_PSEHS|nr:hypothetical protein PHSY_001771 [Pseudozyma hubeiensis SY62]GAC94200.1 hypothetical protein PHSY_001771 [Pseudozyma hubeiensis SY62]